MLKKVRKTIIRQSMLSNGDHLLVAVSGGPDSVALLRALVLLAPEYQLRLTTAHLNHGIRGNEADNEEDFVRRMSREMGISCVCKTIDIPSLRAGRGQSLEEVGREERYSFLAETAHACGARKIATGHHRNDQAETMLINMIRGTGLEGLKGIASVRDDRVIRPLLDVSREEILAFLGHEKLPYMIDSSNRDPIYLRNRIRNELIPGLQARYNPNIIQGLCRTAEIVRREDDYLQKVVCETMHNLGIRERAEEIHIPLSAFIGLHEAIQARIIKRLLEAATPSKTGGGFVHIESVLSALRFSRTNRSISIDLPRFVSVEMESGTLRIWKRSSRHTRRDEEKVALLDRDYSYPVEVPGVVYIPEIDRHIHIAFTENPGLLSIRKMPRVAFMDCARIFPPLVLRNVKPGDRFEPMGMAATKKVKSFFIDRKIPRKCRMRIPLLVDSRSVIWIAGEMISDRVKVTEQTKKMLRVEMV